MIGPRLGAALFAVGILLNVEPVAWLLKDVWMRGIDQGWATLVGAIVGLSAVAWQTRRGLAHLIASQRNQAELDRQARIDQAELERKQLEWRKNQEAKELAASLRGELIAVYYTISKVQQYAAMLVVIYNAIIKQGHEAKFPLKFPKFYCPIYEANAYRIGVLGADLAADVAQVFGISNLRSEDMVMDSVDIAVHKAMQEGLKEGLLDMMDDINHVVMRLRAFEYGKKDPGILALHRKECSKKKKISNS